MTTAAAVLRAPAGEPAPEPRRAVAASLAGTAVAGVAGLVVTWLVTRGLGTAAAGAFFAATAAFTLVGALARLGTLTGLVYWPARLRAQGQPGLVRPCLRAALGPVAVTAVALGTALFIAAPGIARAAADPAEVGGYAAALRVLAVFLPLAALGDAVLAATRGLRQISPTVLLDRLTRPVLQVLGVATLAAVGATTAPAYAIAWVAPVTVVAVLGARALRRGLAPYPERADTTRIGAAFWRFTAPRALANVAQSALQRVDVLLVATLAGLTAAATYAVATRFLVLGQAVNNAIVQAIQPRLAELLAAGARDAANEMYQTATAWLVLATWPLYLLITGLASVYLGLFGPAYRAGGSAVVILGSAMLVATGCGMVDTVLAMAGRTSWNLANVLLALAVNVTLMVLLVPRYGITGAAVALAFALLVNNIVPLVQVAAAVRLHPFGTGTLAAGALAVSCLGVLPLLVVAVAGTGQAVVVTAVAAGALGYLAGAFRLRRVLRLDTLPTLRRSRVKEA